MATPERRRSETLPYPVCSNTPAIATKADQGSDPTRWRRPGFVAFGTLVCVLVLGGVAEAWSGRPGARDGGVVDETERPQVRVALVTELEQRAGATFTGVVAARDRARLAFELDGRLSSRIELGRRLAQDEEIVRVDASGQQAEFEVVEARVQQSALEVSARLDRLKRSRELASVGVAGDESVRRERYEVGIARARRSAARAERTLAEELADGAILRAPFTGVITRVWSSPGEFVRSGEAVLELQRDDTLELRLSVPEDFIGELSVGDTLAVGFPRLRGQREGTVRAILPAAAGSGLFPVLLDLPGHDAGISAGVSASVTLPHSTVPRPAVPVEAIVDPAGSAASVYVVEGGHVERVWVDVVGVNADRVLVNAALRGGQHVVTAGAAALADGAAVQVTGDAL